MERYDFEFNDGTHRWAGDPVGSDPDLSELSTENAKEALDLIEQLIDVVGDPPVDLRTCIDSFNGTPTRSDLKHQLLEIKGVLEESLAEAYLNPPLDDQGHEEGD